MDRHREIDHSGDAGIEAFAATREGLFEQAALGLFGLMLSGRATATATRDVVAESSAPEDLLLEWLSEIVSLGSAQGEVYVGVRVVSLGADRVRGVLDALSAATVAPQLRFDVKAATYHEYVCEQREEGFFARVIFDL